jgi:hypothetical protein
MRLREMMAIGVALGWCLGQDCRAAELEGVRFLDRVSIGDSQLRLRGMGLLRHRFFLKGYVAALYLHEGFEGEVTSAAVLADVPRRLEIEHFWSIPADSFAEITRDGIARSVDEGTYRSLEDRIEQLNELYADVEPGDRYSLTYLPGIGTVLALNGVSRGRVEGADFSSALFSLWIGERALDARLREQLLATP